MTLLPSSDFGIKGWEGSAYSVNEFCAHPTCGRQAVHKHHMWPRSYLRKQPQDWVRLGDGTIIGNLVGLCVEHHDMVTGEIGGYRSRLMWMAGVMHWEDVDKTIQVPEGQTLWTYRGPLDPQPPVVGREADDTPVGARLHHDHSDDVMCPVCGHHKTTQEPRARQERRKAKEWTMHVPDDMEIGADVLDDFIEDFAIPLGATEWSSRLKRYHVTVAVFAWVTANRSQFIADVAKAAEKRLAG